MKAGSVLKACFEVSYESLKIVIGLFIFVCWLIVVILSTPIYIYRFILSRLASRYHNGTFGKIVAAPASLFALEFLPSYQDHSPKCVIVATIVNDGKVSIEEMRKLIEDRWLPSRSNNTGYAELQQYVESWKGFLFWKKDLNFSIKNHIKPYQIEGISSNDVEQNVQRFMEELLNKPFHPKRSPWEWFVVNNYQNDCLKGECKNEEMTIHIFRFHHCLGDGYSLVRAVIEKLVGTSMEAALVAAPSHQTATKRLLTALSLPFRFLVDMRHIFELYHAAQVYSAKTPFHALAKGGLLYKRHEVLIPVNQIRETKERLGVTFTGVLLSALSAAVAKTLHQLQNKKEKNVLINTVKLFIVLPLSGHPDELRNHITLTYIELPTSLKLHPIDRVNEVEKLLKRARKNTLPLLYPFFTKSFGSHLPILTKFFTSNRSAPVGYTNLPGPALDLSFNGKRGLRADFIAGTSLGTAGVLINTFSFRDHVRISASCGSVVMDKPEIEGMLANIVTEINTLHEI